ncbi:hypothetical protein V5799_028770 [Amblyomma americanum]|uniref:Uncharacterized protein n=1 Tax=Amblyomma americanum TaxID=6943 RepID=A0AAQ4DBX6_AMBAM
MTDLVTANQPDSLVVNASAARVDAREDRQHPSVIDNTGIRGSPSGGPPLHELETGYDPVSWQPRSIKEHSPNVPDLVTADQQDSLVVEASAARADVREDRYHPCVIDNTSIRGSPPDGPALHEVETGYDPVAWQHRSIKEHSFIMPDLVTANQPDRLVVNASAARADAREDRQHPCVIDNTVIKGSPSGGPALHEVETGYDPVAWQHRSSKELSLIVPDLVTADQPDSLVVNASSARADAREDRQHPSVIDNTGIWGSPSGGLALHEVETGYDLVAWQQRSSKELSLIVSDLVTADQPDSLVVNASSARVDAREDQQHPSVIDNTGIRGSPSREPALHEVATGYDLVGCQQRSSKEHSLIMPDLVTANKPDSLVVNASAARVDAREDRQHPCVIDNTVIKGSPSGGPALHEVETGYDPVAWQQLSSRELSLIVPDLVTADQHYGLVVNASAARVDAREDRYHPCVIDNTGIRGSPSDQPHSLVINASAARVDAREDRQHPSVIDNTSIRGSPPGGPPLHEVETGYDPVACQQRSSKEHSLIMPDIVTANQPDSLVVNASAARADAREDRQHPCVIDNTVIKGSPSGGPALHEVETGYDPVAWQQLSSKELSLIVPDLVTADQPDSLVVNASSVRDDAREDRQHPSVIDNTGIRGSPSGGPALHEVETGYDTVTWQQRGGKKHSLIVPDLVTADQQDSLVVNASAT